MNSFYARIARGAAEAAYEHGFSLVLCDSGDHPGRERDYFDMLAEQRAVGVVVVPLGADPDRLTRLRRRGVPLVLTDRKLPPQEGCSVAVDDVTGGRGIRQCADRYQGARQAIRSRRGARLDQAVAGQMTVAAGAAIARDLSTLPDSVFCTNDFLAVGVCQGLAERGIRVPGDVQVVGYGDLDVATPAAVPLTTIRQPVEDLGRTAVQLLMDENEASDEHVHETRVFGPRLVPRHADVSTSTCRRCSAAPTASARRCASAYAVRISVLSSRSHWRTCVVHVRRCA
ncbi:substrate-binding domain-containing protein [Streptomyces sp. NPDC004629]|uniref:substrate-binding domain-containing protein n=1 Tax=Streptomyces sp. NPDC004629 TaxID=3364705 RepID=UPI0036860188